MVRVLSLSTICSCLWLHATQVQPFRPAKSRLSTINPTQHKSHLFVESSSSGKTGGSTSAAVDRRSLLIGTPFASLALASGGFLSETNPQTLPVRGGASPLDNKSWVGSSLKLMSVDDAYEFSLGDDGIFPFAHWPDQILRRPASRLDITTTNYQSPVAITTLRSKVQGIAKTLQQTAHHEGAVGLAAQQCGVDLSLVYVKTRRRDSIFLLNPRIVNRSPEHEMLVWSEECLVLPPSFRATVLRDAVVTIEYEDPFDETDPGAFLTKQITLTGELARCAQHEMQHDRGILIVDHVLLEELPDYMRDIEAEQHQIRMREAFSREFVEPSQVAVPAPDNKLSARRISDPPSFLVPRANAMDSSEQTVAPVNADKPCDEECLAERKRIIEQRRAMMKQGRTTVRRQDLFDLSQQRAALYGTTYRGAQCPGNSTIPCM